MIKRGKILVVSFVFLFGLACAQQKNRTDDTSPKEDLSNNSNQYLNDTRPGYYLQINNQNCYYELNINDLNSTKYYGKYPIHSTRVPINYEILKSGNQNLSITILPYKGENLSTKADLKMRLMVYPNMKDIENDFGGSTTLWEWKTPNIKMENLPFIKFDTVFKAEVPYEITTLDKRAVDLSEMDTEKLLKEVVKEFTIVRKSIINKTQNVGELKRFLKIGLIQTYEDEKYGDETIKDMLSIGEGKEPQPLEDFEMRLYYNSRIVTLVKRDDKEPAIWFKNTETGARSWQPVYLYKDVTTGKWMRW